MRGVLNDAVSIYFADTTLAGAFVARWCVGSKAEADGGVFQVREDEPTPTSRISAASDAMRRDQISLAAGRRMGGDGCIRR
jgi:hypothetical protein